MDKKSWILLRAMQACGAIYATHHGWQEVSDFVTGTMATLQNAILWEFVSGRVPNCNGHKLMP